MEGLWESFAASLDFVDAEREVVSGGVFDDADDVFTSGAGAAVAGAGADFGVVVVLVGGFFFTTPSNREEFAFLFLLFAPPAPVPAPPTPTPAAAVVDGFAPSDGAEPSPPPTSTLPPKISVAVGPILSLDGTLW